MPFRLILLVLLVLLCCGCYAHDTTITINRDGSGTFEVTAGINKSYERSEVAAGRLAVDSDIARVVLNSFQATSQDLSPDWKPSVATWDDGTFAGAKLTLSFTNLAMLQAQLKKVLALTQDSGRDDLFTDMQARQINDQLEVSSALTGQDVTTDNGGPLPSGPEGVGRISWAVSLPQIDTTTPQNDATRTGNLVRWSVPLTTLKPGTSLLLTTRGRLIANSPTIQPTAQPSTQPSVTSPPTATAVPTPTALSGNEPTAELAPQPSAGNPAPATTPAGATPAATLPAAITPTVVAPATIVVATQPPAATQQVLVPSATYSPLPTYMAAVAPSLAPTTLATMPTVATTPTALATLRPQASPAITDQAFAPLAGAALPTPAPGVGSAPPAQPQSSLYRYLPVVLLLICSALCLSYVALRRAQRRRSSSSG